MSEFKFELASEKDDADLRDLLLRTPMQGMVSLSFLREPSYFKALEVEGISSQVIVARERNTGGIVALGTRSITKAYVNGAPASVGFLSNLRILPQHRGGALLARGYQYLRKLHMSDNKAPFYLTTIMSGNLRALTSLTSRRCGLPLYKPWGQLITAIIPTGQKTRTSAAEISRGQPERLREIAGFMRREGAQKQFYPLYEEEDLLALKTKNFSVENFFIAGRNGAITGAIARWDQKSFRQIKIHDYYWAVKLLRPLYNAVAKISGYPQLPSPGATLNICYASAIAVKENNGELFAAILSGLLADSRKAGYDFVLAALHERDPLLKALNCFRYFKLRSRLFLVSFDEDDSRLESLKTAIPYLEIARI